MRLKPGSKHQRQLLVFAPVLPSTTLGSSFSAESYSRSSRALWVSSPQSSKQWTHSPSVALLRKVAKGDFVFIQGRPSQLCSQGQALDRGLGQERRCDQQEPVRWHDHLAWTHFLTNGNGQHRRI